MAPGLEEEPLRRASCAAERAVELDSTLPEAHASLAGSQAFEGLWVEAEKG